MHGGVYLCTVRLGLAVRYNLAAIKQCLKSALTPTYIFLWGLLSCTSRRRRRRHFPHQVRLVPALEQGHQGQLE